MTTPDGGARGRPASAAVVTRSGGIPTTASPTPSMHVRCGLDHDGGPEDRRRRSVCPDDIAHLALEAGQVVAWRLRRLHPLVRSHRHVVTTSDAGPNDRRALGRQGLQHLDHLSCGGQVARYVWAGARLTGIASLTSMVNWYTDLALRSLTGLKKLIRTSQQSESIRQYGLLDTSIVSRV